MIHLFKVRHLVIEESFVTKSAVNSYIRNLTNSVYTNDFTNKNGIKPIERNLFKKGFEGDLLYEMQPSWSDIINYNILRGMTFEDMLLHYQDMYTKIVSGIDIPEHTVKVAEKLHNIIKIIRWLIKKEAIILEIETKLPKDK